MQLNAALTCYSCFTGFDRIFLKEKVIHFLFF